MSILSDKEILLRCINTDKPMIEGVTSIDQIEYLYDLDSVGDVCGVTKIMGYGIDSYGYDARLGEKAKLFTPINTNGEIFDPKRPTERGRVDAVIEQDGKEKWIVVPPGHFLLGHCPEYIRVPSDCIGLVSGKSGYARNGIIVNPTVLKPGWEGEVVLEIHNATPVPVRVYVNEGIAHFIFIKADSLCERDYLGRGGKYQAQRGVTPGRA